MREGASGTACDILKAPLYTRPQILMGLTQRETVVALLETYRDVLLPDLPAVGSITLRADSRLLQLNKLYHDGSYAELERVLKWMRNQGYQQAYEGVALHKLHWHVMEWYIRAEKVRRNVPRTMKKSGKVVQLRDVEGRLVTTPKIVYRRHKDAREKKVDLGVDWMLLSWDKVNPKGRRPQLPRDLLEVLAA
jgi:hypothetical protein